MFPMYVDSDNLKEHEEAIETITDTDFDDLHYEASEIWGEDIAYVDGAEQHRRDELVGELVKAYVEERYVELDELDEVVEVQEWDTPDELAQRLWERLNS